MNPGSTNAVHRIAKDLLKRCIILIGGKHDADKPIAS